MAKYVEIISKEMIKPLTPTPTHLKTLKLSLLDQLAIPVYVPLIFFYPHHQLITLLTHPQQICALLKQSLSKILTLFYPLSGVVQQNSWVDCNDSGAEFVESRVAARLSDLVQEANVDELKKLFPDEDEKQVLLKVRLNFFECGGVAIAVCLWHKLCDGTALVAFIEAWAATCRGGETKIRHPSFDFASIFPPVPPSESLDFIQGTGVTRDRIVTKRLVFNKEKIEKLKEEFNGGSSSCTRVEAVSSYIWGRFIDAAGSKTSSFAASHVVNLRPRKRPPISQDMFGNCWRPVVAMSDDNSQLAAKLRAAIASVDDDFIKKVENGEYMKDLKRVMDLFTKGGVEFCHFSSWCRFPLYEVDFGWGKPVRVCTTSLPIKNIVILMATPCGQGIEAWVNMLEDDMQAFV